MEFIVRGIRDFGEPGILIAFEETSEELATNIASLGSDPDELIRKGLLRFHALRSTLHGVEQHLATAHK